MLSSLSRAWIAGSFNESKNCCLIISEEVRTTGSSSYGEDGVCYSIVAIFGKRRLPIFSSSLGYFCISQKNNSRIRLGFSPFDVFSFSRKAVASLPSFSKPKCSLNRWLTLSLKKTFSFCWTSSRCAETRAWSFWIGMCILLRKLVKILILKWRWTEPSSSVAPRIFWILCLRMKNPCIIGCCSLGYDPCLQVGKLALYTYLGSRLKTSSYIPMAIWPASS
mmetsp:Transcript_28565/g.43191  ORF Transcript_28565/g.43191 Transcript_28565/m.43191 type:complete len:221 (-) Transcript_28565:290-952(-)